MANYFSDNQDIKFLLDYFDLKEIAALQERETPNGDADYAPRDLDDAVDNYRRVLEIVGEISAETLAADFAAGAPKNEDGTVNLIEFAAWLVKGEDGNANQPE